MRNTLKYAVVLDFEATCDDRESPKPQEIIEFPSIILSLDTLEIIDEFRSFVRPYHNPRLTHFCKNFTSITQEQVDSAELFHKVLKEHHSWMQKHGLTPENSVIVTCGDWDLGTMLPAQCSCSVPRVETIPPHYLRWHNIKRSFAKFKNIKKAGGMASMLKALKLPLIGHHHCGIDDCRNIAEILKVIVKSGAKIDFTGKLPIAKYPPISLKLSLGDETHNIELNQRNMKTLIALTRKTFKRSFTELHLSDGTVLSQDNDLVTLNSYQEIRVR